MEDLHIGSEITLKVIETEGCNDYFFGGQICEHIKCCKDERKDKKDVQFKRVK